MSVAGSPFVASGEVSSRKKRTRTRKRRTRTEAGDDEMASEQEDEEEKEEQPSRKSDKVAALADDTAQDGLTKDHTDEQENDENISGKPKEKRKRKRTRGKGKKEEVENGDTAKETSDPVRQAPSTPSASMQKYLDSLGDPHDKGDSLGEKTINALGYARQYHLARSEWKFNKAKQEYLIRHMLTPPPTQTATEIDSSKLDVEESAEKEEDDIADQQHWPDEWNRCVAKYLATIQGKAKLRLMEILTKAAEQIIPAMPVQVVTSAPSTEGVSGAINAPGKKSVSFGDLAMIQDAVHNEGSDLSTSTSAADVQRRQFQKDRAIKLLAELAD